VIIVFVFQLRVFSFWALRATPVVIDERGDAGFGAKGRTGFELKRALSGQVSKLIEEMNEALKILSDMSERCLVEVGRLLVQGPYVGEVVPQLHQAEHRPH